MKTKVFLSVAGLAVCGATVAQDRPALQTAEFSGQTSHAVRATAIIGLTVDGQYVYGETVELGQNNARFNGAITSYDSALMADTDLDGMDLDPVCADLAPHLLGGPSSRYFFGTEFSWQSFAEDVIPAAGTEGGIVDELVFAGTFPICDNGAGTTSEVLQIVFSSWENIDNFPDLDGTDGFDVGFPAPLVSPFDQNDIDGDTFVDEFNGGVILTYADTANGLELFSQGALGYGIFFATGLSTLGLPMPSGTDYDGDTDSDGGIQIQWTRGDGGDGLGDLLGGFYPSTRAASMLWGTTAMEQPGTTCAYPNATYPGFGLGDSDGIVWGEGEDLCNDPGNAGGDWSTGGLDPTVNDMLDPDFDVADWFGIVPDFESLGLMIRIRVAGGVTPQDCCDINQDTFCTAADFSAWIAAFNAGASTCDVNQDTFCTAADFSAWIAAFNNSTAGNPDQCVF